MTDKQQLDAELTEELKHLAGWRATRRGWPGTRSLSKAAGAEECEDHH